MTTLPAVSVIVPLGKHNELLEPVVAAILSLDYPGFEVIMTEGSKGEAESMLRRYPDGKITYVKGTCKNPAGLRNLGVAAARNDLLAFLDSDCIPEPSWLKELVIAKETLKVRMVVGATRSANADSNRWARVAAKRYAMWFAGATRGSFVARIDTKNLLVEKSYLVSLGLFDEKLDSKEDRDLGLRVLRSGDQIGYAPKAVVRHFDPQSVRALYRRAVWYARGMRQFRAKYGVGLFSQNPDPIYHKRYAGEGNWAMLSIAWFACVAALAWTRWARGTELAILLLVGIFILVMAFRSLLKSFAKFLLGRTSWEDFVFDLVTDLGHKVGWVSTLPASRGRREGTT